MRIEEVRSARWSLDSVRLVASELRKGEAVMKDVAGRTSGQTTSSSMSMQQTSSLHIRQTVPAAAARPHDGSYVVSMSFACHQPQQSANTGVYLVKLFPQPG